jgi:hypothetical protein
MTVPSGQTGVLDDSDVRYRSEMPIIPDDKDWTWVLQRPCPECGFDATSMPRDELPAAIRTNAQTCLSILALPPALLRRRVRDDRWSALEYGCHVRDTFRVYDRRLELMLTTENPNYPNWDQDQTALDDAYNEQDPGTVATELQTGAERLAMRFAGVGGVAWDRPGERSDGTRFTIDSFGRYLIHDPVHHLHDVDVDVDLDLLAGEERPTAG